MELLTALLEVGAMLAGITLILWACTVLEARHLGVPDLDPAAPHLGGLEVIE